MTRINGQQARHLLDGITGGQWYVYHDMYAEEGEPVSTIQTEYPDSDIAPIADGGGVRSPEDGRLMASAPDLAETVAWLHGRESDLEREHYTNWDPTDRADQWGVSAMKWKGNVLLGDNHSMQASELTPDEAVDLARALLAAAQEARREV